MKHQHYVRFVTFVAAMGGVLFGFDTGVIAGAIPFINDNFHPSLGEIQLIVSMLVLGAFLGALCSGKLANSLGRKKLLLYISVIFLLGTSICTFADSIFLLIVGRFILGIAVGVTSYTVPLFIAEIAMPEQRGSLVILNGFCLTGAQALAFIFDYWFSKIFSSDFAWRVMIGVSAIPALLLLIGIAFIPESPRWLLFKGKKEEALTVLKKIRKPENIAEEITEIEQTLTTKHLKFRELFTSKVRGVILIGLVLGIGQQFVGINTVMYYGPEIFKEIGFTSISSQIMATFGMGLINFLFTIFCPLTADRLGRRKLLIVGMSLVTFSLILFGFMLANHVQASFLAKVLAVSTLVSYMAGYSMSVGTVFWLLIAEIYPLSARSLGMSFVASVQWLANFVVSATFLTIMSLFGSSVTFWLYGFAAGLVLTFIFFYVPETKGVSLETIESNLYKGAKLRDLGIAE